MSLPPAQLVTAFHEMYDGELDELSRRRLDEAEALLPEVIRREEEAKAKMEDEDFIADAAAYLQPAKDGEEIFTSLSDWLVDAKPGQLFAQATMAQVLSVPLEEGLQSDLGNCPPHWAVKVPNVVNLTGQGGTGKSYCGEKMSDEAQLRQKKVMVTASTGVAALIAGGQTIHSVTGLSSGKAGMKCWAKFDQERGVAINEATFLRLDEFSMMPLPAIQCISRCFTGLKKKLQAWDSGLCEGAMGGVAKMPFGGIAVLLSGDEL
jgi:hypothetical protein